MFPGLLRFLMNLGLRWLPQWSSSPVKDSAIGVSGAKKTPFHRLLWELFAVSLWDKASLLGADGKSPSQNSRLWSFSAECKEWASRYILPLFCYCSFPRPSEGGMLSRLSIFFMESISTCRFRRIDWLSCLSAYLFRLDFCRLVNKLPYWTSLFLSSLSFFRPLCFRCRHLEV